MVDLVFVLGGLFFGFVVVVGYGIVSFLFGMDIVGFGWVLVVFNNIVGLKLMFGILLVIGVVFVCWIFDMVLIFVLIVDDVYIVY